MAENKHLHYGHRSRLRDRVKKEGLDNFQDYQVLEYALSFVLPYKDTNPIAHDLVNKFGSFNAVLEADEEEIANITGMGEVSAHFLTALPQLFSFYEKGKSKKQGKIDNPQDTFNFVKSYFAGSDFEQIYMVSLAPNNRIIRVDKLGEGNNDYIKVDIRKITDIMAKYKVNNIVIAHNHPSGDMNPSADDDKFTKALVTCLAISGSHLIDHVIVCGANDYYSYRSSGLLDVYKNEVGALLINKVAQPMAKYEVEDDKKW